MFATPSVRAKLRDKKRQIGVFCNMSSPISTELAARVGFDVILIDQEHSPGDFFNAMTCMDGVKGTNAEAWVRVPSNDPVFIKRILDCGADGIMCPSIGSAEEARNLVTYCHYPPKGIRGVAPTMGRNSSYGMRRDEYLSRVSDDLAIMPQIESPEGVKNIDEIAKVDGIEIIFIGPMDLAASLGHFGKVDHPDVQSAIGKVEKAIKNAGKSLGSLAMPGQDVNVLLDRGYDLIFAGADIGFLRMALQEQYKLIKSAL